MSTSTSASVNHAQKETSGLPRVNYTPPVATTLLAAMVLFLTMLGLVFFGILNTLTQFDRASRNEVGGSTVGATVCGILTLLALLGVVYFAFAILKGFRDLTGKLYFTRGIVLVRPGVPGRNAKNWLLIDPTYLGDDIQAASAITDEQRASSVDRSQIFNSRFSPAPERRKPDILDEDLKDKLDRTERTERAAGGGYLNPARIAANQPIRELESPELPPARVVFRIDFANKAGITAGEEVLVAHSRFLQHVYYVARLRNGEWVPFRNRSLI